MENEFKCPNCGAPISPQEKKCSYCGSPNKSYNLPKPKEVGEDKKEPKSGVDFGDFFGDDFGGFLGGIALSKAVKNLTKTIFPGRKR